MPGGRKFRFGRRRPARAGAGHSGDPANPAVAVNGFLRPDRPDWRRHLRFAGFDIAMTRGRIILIAIILLVLGAMLGGGFYFRAPLKKMVGLGGDEAESTAAPTPPPKKEVKPEDIVFCDLPDMMVTLSNHGGPSNHIVKFSISLQLNDKNDQPHVNSYIPRVVDVFQVYVRQLGIEDVVGPEHLRKLRDALLPRLNAALDPAHVDDVLFREVMVQ
jgi:flagellar protein FliL